MQSLQVLLVFGGLIFFHELGHFLVARFFNMGVKTFSLGFGPVLFARVFGKTKYQVAGIPLGGYVALVGETADAEIPAPFTREESFALRPAWQRFFVILAGSVFNLLLAWVICWGLLYYHGKVEIAPVIGRVTQNSPAHEAGLMPGDTITAFNQRKISRWEQIPFLLQINQGTPIVVHVDRPGYGPTQITVSPRLTKVESRSGKPLEIWLFGIEARGAHRVELSFFEAAGAGAEKAKDMLETTWLSLKALVDGSIPASTMGGPLGIAQEIHKSAGEGVSDLMIIAALISVNLGFLNLLPIPILDGGHLMFLTFEMLTRRAVPVKIQEKAMMVGLALLLSLMFFATFNDVVRIFS